MSQFTRDPIANAIYGGIKPDIQLLLAHDRFRGALLLIYAGMDAMAYVGMDPAKTDVERADFVAWTEKYIGFPSSEQLTGLDLYGARCALLHQYSVFSRLSREGECRLVGYVDYIEPPVVSRPEINSGFVMVSVRGLADAFFTGLDRFLVDVIADPARRAVAEARLGKLILHLPIERGS